jgi:hypothetical protein
MMTTQRRNAPFAFAMLFAAHGIGAQPDPWSESYRLEYIGKHAEALAQIEPFATRQPSMNSLSAARL